MGKLKIANKIDLFIFSNAKNASKLFHHNTDRLHREKEKKKHCIPFFDFLSEKKRMFIIESYDPHGLAIQIASSEESFYKVGYERSFLVIDKITVPFVGFLTVGNVK